MEVRKKIPLNLTKDIPSNILIHTLRSTEGQSVEGFGKSSYGIVGAFGGVAGGVAISNDGGKTFESNAVSVLNANHPVRYGLIQQQIHGLSQLDLGLLILILQ